VGLRIAFDLDGVLADMESQLIRQSETLFGEAMTRRLLERPDLERGDEPLDKQDSTSDVVTDNAPALTRLNMTSRQRRRLWQQVHTVDNFWESLTEIEPGIVQRLATLAADRQWEIIFLTTRPETAGLTAQVQSQRWLESRGFPLPSVFVVRKSRGRIAAALGLDIVVDDRHENCLDVVSDSKARAILVWRGDEKHLPPSAKRLGVGVVKSVEECLAILIQIDSAKAEPAGVMSRLKKFFGMKDQN
jgi:hypothetical protein